MTTPSSSGQAAPGKPGDDSERPTIRPAAAQDLAPIELLLTARSLPVAGVADSLDGFLLAEHAGVVVGVVGIESCGAYGLLRSTAVASDWQGRGLGRQLVERAITVAEARGVQALYLLTTTAERYFPTFGFVAIAREQVPAVVRATSEFASVCPASATVMMLGLTPRPRAIA